MLPNSPARRIGCVATWPRLRTSTCDADTSRTESETASELNLQLTIHSGWKELNSTTQPQGTLAKQPSRAERNRAAYAKSSLRVAVVGHDLLLVLDEEIQQTNERAADV